MYTAKKSVMRLGNNTFLIDCTVLHIALSIDSVSAPFGESDSQKKS